MKRARHRFCCHRAALRETLVSSAARTAKVRSIASRVLNKRSRGAFSAARTAQRFQRRTVLCSVATTSFRRLRLCASRFAHPLFLRQMPILFEIGLRDAHTVSLCSTAVSRRSQVEEQRGIQSTQTMLEELCSRQAELRLRATTFLQLAQYTVDRVYSTISKHTSRGTRVCDSRNSIGARHEHISGGDRFGRGTSILTHPCIPWTLGECSRSGRLSARR